MDKLNKNCGVYLIVSPTGGRYVGSSKRLDKRFNRYKNCSCSKQSAIYSSLRKYGPQNHKFKVLMYCVVNELLFWERVFGDIYLSLAEHPQGLNLILPGYDDVPEVRDAAFRKRVSEAQRARFKDPEQRRKTSESTKRGFTESVRKAMKESSKQSWASEEKRRKKSEQMKRHYSNKEVRLAASEAAKKWQKERPEAASKSYAALVGYYKNNPDKRGLYFKANKGNKEFGQAQGKRLKEFYKNNPEARRVASERTKRQLADPANNVRSKKVINVDTGEIISCARLAAERLGVPQTTFWNWLRGVSPNPTPYRYYQQQAIKES